MNSMLKKAANIVSRIGTVAKRVFKAVFGLGKETEPTVVSVARFRVQTLRRVACAAFVVAFVVLGASFIMNAADAVAMPDPSTIVSTVSTLAYNVGTLVAAVVLFFIGVKIVKWIRK